MNQLTDALNDWADDVEQRVKRLEQGWTWRQVESAEKWKTMWGVLGRWVLVGIGLCLLILLIVLVSNA